MYPRQLKPGALESDRRFEARRRVLPVFAQVGLATIALLMGASITTQSQAQSSNGLEDIDLFVNPTPASDIPNVLLILDNSKNWSASFPLACASYADGTAGPDLSSEREKKIGSQKCAIVNTLLSLPVNTDGSAKFRVGIKYLNSAPAKGSYPRTRFLEVTAANKIILANTLKNTRILDNADESDNAEFDTALWESYLWFKGLAPRTGNTQNTVSRRRDDLGAYGADSRYISPSGSSCGKNFIIMITNGVAQGSDSGLPALIRSAGGNATEITYSNSYITTNTQNNWSDEVARFLRGTDVSSQEGTQNIITFTVALTKVDPTPADQRDYNFISEIANQGGGSFFSATNLTELTNSLKSIFNQIQAVNSVYASASLPVSVNSQGTFLNQVFLGVFRPDAESRPRWVGNLKQYQFGFNAGTQAVSLVDSLGAPAVNPGTGFIQPDAVSFWTAARPYTDFWKNESWPGEVNSGGASDYPDGQLVEKGGVAQRLREANLTADNRTVYTTTSAGSASLATFAKNGTIRGLVVPGNNSEADDVIDWAKGRDNKTTSDENGPGTLTSQATAGGATSTVSPTVRATIHGDIVHSRPAVVNYGGSTGVVVFYGANNGFLHAVCGKQSGSCGNTPAGGELWSFIPFEFLPKLKRQRDNSPILQFANTDMTQTPTPQRKDYGMDGPISFYQKQGANAAVWMFAGMRRGGRALYAFDVTNPASPSLKWKLTTSEVSQLGFTWSEARVTRIAGINDPVLIMGGGYDPAEDTASPSTTMGNVVVVLNANTGAVLKTFTGISRPVPAPVAIVDDDGDGKMDRAYAVDLGGSVYRMMLPGSDPAGWTVQKIADFASASGQKMFFAPAVLKTGIEGLTAGTVSYAIQVGSGDREKPLQSTGTANRFYTLLDRGQTSAVTLTDLQEMTISGLSSLASNKYGCYFNLPNAGEKIVNATTYTGGNAFFATNTPTSSSANSCTGNLGVARSYAIPAFCGPVTSTELVGGGFPPTAVVGTVLIPPAAVVGQPVVNCEVNPEQCRQVPIGIGITPPDCQGNATTVTSAIGASNIYACAPTVRFRRDWSISNPR